MKRHVGFFGSILLGAAMVTVGLSGNLALAQSVDAKDNQLLLLKDSKVEKVKPCEGDKKCGSIPEPASLILLGAGLAGLGIWSWKRNSRKV